MSSKNNKMTLADFNFNNDNKKKYINKSIDKEYDKWKIYLFDIFQGELKTRLEEMIPNSECKPFFEGIKYEYGYGVEKNLRKALSIYKESARYESKDYLSMARLFDIYKNETDKFKIKKDKNLELIYLFKSFSYLPFSILSERDNRFPLDLPYIIASFLDKNDKTLKNFHKYFDKLMKEKKYIGILSENDCNLIKGFTDSYFIYSFGDIKKSLDILTALSFSEYLEATYKLIYVYLERLKKMKEDKVKEELISKIYDLFLILEDKKYYKAYADYGLFLYNDLRIFDKSLEIFEEGYKHKQFECAYFYFLSFIKSGNPSIYDAYNFDEVKFIEIFKSLIDSFIYGEIRSNDNIFDYFYTIGKRYNLLTKLSNNYMKYLNEIAKIYVSFHDKNNGEINLKKYSQDKIDKLKYYSDHSLSLIYMYGLSTEFKKDLIKALKHIKNAIKYNSFIIPYYTRLKYKIKKKLFNLGVFEDKNKLIKLENKLFELYKKNENYDKYGNSFYYYFGKLYEKGIGTEKNYKKALYYYQKGCKPFFNLYDNFIISFARYLSLKKIELNIFKFNQINLPKFNVNFCLSHGEIKISLLIHNEMTVNDIKVELYKKKELQNLIIKCLLFNANALNDNEIIGKYGIKENENIIVIVESSQNIPFY